LSAIFEVVLDYVQQAVFVDDFNVGVVWVGGFFADVVGFDDGVDVEVVQTGFAGEVFGVGCFAYAWCAGAGKGVSENNGRLQ
jgi:hypothetical protein